MTNHRQNPARVPVDTPASPGSTAPIGQALPEGALLDPTIHPARDIVTDDGLSPATVDERKIAARVRGTIATRPLSGGAPRTTQERDHELIEFLIRKAIATCLFSTPAPPPSTRVVRRRSRATPR
jgi:hypothetical protein